MKSAYYNPDRYWHLTIALSVVFALASLPANAFAVDAIGQAMCNIVSIAAGTTGKAICTVNIIALGIGALLGKLSWNKAMTCVVGVGLVFGSAGVVSALNYNSDPLFGGSDAFGGASAAAAGEGGGSVTAEAAGTGTGSVSGTGTGTKLSSGLTEVGSSCIAHGSLVSQ